MNERLYTSEPVDGLVQKKSVDTILWSTLWL